MVWEGMAAHCYCHTRSVLWWPTVTWCTSQLVPSGTSLFVSDDGVQLRCAAIA
jgi:hypothetical protein